VQFRLLSLNLGCLHPVACLRSGDGGGGLFRLRNVTIAGYFYYLLSLKLVHVSVVRIHYIRYSRNRPIGL
jgi:hypothetical protein